MHTARNILFLAAVGSSAASLTHAGPAAKASAPLRSAVAAARAQCQAGNPCSGISTSAILSDAQRFKDLVRAIAWSPGLSNVERKTDCDQPRCGNEHADVRANVFADQYPLEALTGSAVMVAGKMSLRTSQNRERRYQLGGKNDADNHEFYLVASAAGGDLNTSADDGHVVAVWQWYGLHGNRVTPIGPRHWVVDCGHNLKDHPYAAFFTCQEAATTMMLATLTNASISKTVDALSDCRSFDSDCGATLLRKLEPAAYKQRQKELEALAGRPKKQTSHGVSALGLMDSPYWFSCNYGCCVASSLGDVR